MTSSIIENNPTNSKIEGFVRRNGKSLDVYPAVLSVFVNTELQIIVVDNKKNVFGEKLRNQLLKDLDLFKEELNISTIDRYKYISLFNRSIRQLSEINGGNIVIEPTEDGILVSSRNNGKAIYMDLLLDSDSVFLSMITNGEGVQNITASLSSAILRSNLFLKR